jgi:hypothetical protein
MEDLLKDARAKIRRREWPSKYEMAKNAEQAFETCQGIRYWLEELAGNPCLDHEGEHCVREALRDLRSVRMFLRLAKRRPKS